MHNINESLLKNDLERLVNYIFEIDSYASKMGEDEDVIVLSFTVDGLGPAQDLVNFIEKGYPYVLDADNTAGELKDGKYKVFVELERNRRAIEHIIEILDGLQRITGIKEFKFRYYKSFNSIPVSTETLSDIIPLNADDYVTTIKQTGVKNFSNFFNRSYVESISVDNDDLVFQKMYADPLRMKIKGFGPTKSIYERAPGRIMLETKDMGEVMYLMKYLGNYNINKVGNLYIFENGNHAVALERV